MIVANYIGDFIEKYAISEEKEADLVEGSLGFVYYSAIEEAREGVNDDASGAAVTRRFQKNLESVEHWKSLVKSEREPQEDTGFND